MGGAQPDDPAKLAAAQAKADDLEAKLHAGGDFAQLARTFSDGPTAAEGGDLGQYKRGELAKVFEDQTFALKAGQFTTPIRTKQGFVIMKVVKHVPGGVPAYKDVEQQVGENFFMARMEPAMRDYLTKMREDSFIEIKPGFIDTGASPNKRVFPISYAAYTPPAPKKKKKVERTRFRESTRSYRQKSSTSAAPEKVSMPAAAAKGKKNSSADQASMKPGKKEKIRFGKAPTKTLPSAPAAPTEDAGAVSQTAESCPGAGESPGDQRQTHAEDPLQRPRASPMNQHKPKGPKLDSMAPAAPDAAEVADQQTQAGPLGLAGDTSTRKRRRLPPPRATKPA